MKYINLLITLYSFMATQIRYLSLPKMQKMLFCCFAFLCLQQTTNAQCDHPDYDALMALYQSTNGDNWTNNNTETTILPCGNTELETDEAYEKEYRKYIKDKAYKKSVNTVYTIPVVVHIFHENSDVLGSDENPYDAEIKQIIEETTDRFRHTSGFTYDNPFSGVDTEIEFCLATVDPAGNNTTGINRYVNSYLATTDVDDTYPQLATYSWDTENYLNIILVKEAYTGGIYFGSFDIVAMDTNSFWSGLMAHEIGHYFSLYHTFSGNCTNNDCLLNGDRVCDTPPKDDQGFPSGFQCEIDQTTNSCTSDDSDTSTNNPYRPISLGGMGDQNDMTENYMDYTFSSGLCGWNAFSIGQKNRMRFNIEQNRMELISGINTVCTNPSTVNGCTDVSAINYDSGATNDDGSCIDDCSIYLYYFDPTSIYISYSPVILCGENYGLTNSDTLVISFQLSSNIENFYSISTNYGALNIDNNIPQFYEVMLSISYTDFLSSNGTIELEITGANYNDCSLTEVINLNSTESANCFSQTVINGCTDPMSCNYNINANVDDGSCNYAQDYYDCSGNCVNDTDNDGICDELEIECSQNEISHIISIDLGNGVSTYPNEISWFLFDEDSSTVAGSGSCGAYSSLSGIVNQEVCLEIGTSYAFYAYDDYGDGWNGATINMFSENGEVIINNQMPTDDNSGDNSGNCDFDLEAVYSFTVGIAENCGDNICDSFEDYESCPDDCSCLLPIDLIDVPNLEVTTNLSLATSCGMNPDWYYYGDTDEYLLAFSISQSGNYSVSTNMGIVNNSIQGFNVTLIYFTQTDFDNATIFEVSITDINDTNCSNTLQIPVSDLLGGAACIAEACGAGDCGSGDVLGCTDPTACNYNSSATTNDGTCTYPETYYNCNGNCINDTDGDGICNELEIFGCTDNTALNYNPEATEDDGSCEYENIVNCADGETEYIFTIAATTSDWPTEISWSITDTDGNIVASAPCGTYDGSTDEIVTLCLSNGVEYTFNAFDDYGDGWNGGTFAITDADGNLVYSSSANDGLPGDNTYDCVGDSLEESYTFTPNQTNTCTHPDYNALMALYQSTNGDNWTDNTGWYDGFHNGDCDVCTWFGIECKNDRVTCLDLDGTNDCISYLSVGNNLNGTIPPELGNLTNLTYLGLHNNELSGTIPPELGNLTNLTDLSLLNNELSGAIPPELGNLSNLNYLWLDYNQLSGSISPELGNLTNLTHLGLAYNELTGSIPPELGNLTNLTELWLLGNQLSGSIPPELGNLTNLELINLSYNELSGSIPPELGNLSNLTNLNLGDNELSGTIPPELGNLSNLTEIYLYSNQLSGSIPPELGNLTNLAWLEIRDNTLSGSIPPELGNLTNLTNLFLGNNQLSGFIPPELGNLANLTWLYLNDNQLSGAIPPELGNLTNLTQLYLYNNQLSGAIPPELVNLTNLTQLGLSNNELSGDIPSELGNLSNLTLLFLYNNQLSGAIPPELGNLSNLTRLFLYSNQLSDCISQEIINLCSIGISTSIAENGVNLSNNPLLPYEGDLSQLCVGEPQIGAPCNADNNSATQEYIQEDCSCGSGETTPCTHPDYDALMALYQSTNGDNWTDNTGWYDGFHNGDCDVCSWYGIDCDDVGRVSEIDLWSNELNGTIPFELGNLNNLIVLRLGNNQLSGFIPVELGDLTNLTGLSLGINQLIGTIPSELGNLTKLTYLWLNSNELSGTIPPELDGLTNLYQLWLHYNELSGTIPPELGNLTNLAWLDLRDNTLSGSIPTELGNIGSSSNYSIQLILNDNELSGCVPQSIINLCDSVNVNLFNNPLLPYSGNTELLCAGEPQIGAPCNADNNSATQEYIQEDCSCGANETNTDYPTSDCHPDYNALMALYQSTNGDNWTNNTGWYDGFHNGNCDVCNWFNIGCNAEGRVTEIILNGLVDFMFVNQGNNLVGTIPPEIGELTYLEDLFLGQNSLSGSIPTELGNLTNLTGLSLYNNQLSGSIPPELGNLINLNDLYLNNNQLSGSIPSSLGNLVNLWEFHLENNNLTGTIPIELANFPNILIDGSLILENNNLSGCVPQEILDYYCFPYPDFPSYIPLYTTGNSQLANEGDLLQFCNSNEQIGAPCNADNNSATQEYIQEDCSCGSAESQITNSISGIVYEDFDDNNLYDNDDELLQGASITLINEPCNFNTTATSDENGYYEFTDLENGEYLIAYCWGQVCNFSETVIINNNSAEINIPVQVCPQISGTGIAECIDNEIYLLSGSYNNPNICEFQWYYNDEPIIGQNNPSIPLSILEDGFVSCEATNALGCISTDFGFFIPDGYFLINPQTWYQDLDGDGLGNIDVSIESCEQPEGYVDNSLDDNDTPTTTDYPTSNCHPDYNALMALYQSTNGDNWTDNTGWYDGFYNGDCDVCSWYGITCDESGRVSEIDLSGILDNLFGLSGSIPDELGDLENLTYLDFSSNELSGTIPATIGNLINLSSLSLSNNALSGAIPPEIGNLTNLTELYLSYNALSGTIPTALENLSNLTSLYLNVNEFSGAIPPELGNLINLTTLSLHSNNLSGSIPASLGNLTNLTDLYFSNNNLNGLIPSSLGNLNNLNNLSFGYNNLSGSIPAVLGNLTSLTYLGFDFNNLSGAIPSELGNLINLTSLNLNNNELSGCIPESLLTFCAIDFNLSNNFALSNYGNLDLFCSESVQIGAPCNLDSNPLTIDIIQEDCTCQFENEIPIPTSNCHPDYNALMALYASTNGDTWISNEGWYDGFHNGTCDVCDWAGIECDESGRVACLDMDGSVDCCEVSNCSASNGNNMVGYIPSEIGELSHIKHISFRNNFLYDSIPSVIGSLDSLHYLRLSFNQLTGTIPAELGNLDNLLYLSLTGNELTGNIPATITNLSQLRQLYLSNNQLSGSIPAELSNLDELTSLWLNDNNFSGCVPSIILDVHCELATDTITSTTFYLKNNPLLPYEGDTEILCAGEPQIGAPCNVDNNLATEEYIQEDCSCGSGELLNCPVASLTENIIQVCGDYTGDLFVDAGVTIELADNLFTDDGEEVVWFEDNPPTIPFSGSVPQDNSLGNPLNPPTVYGFLRCDLNGDGFNGSADDSYEFVGEVLISVYTDISLFYDSALAPEDSDNIASNCDISVDFNNAGGIYEIEYSLDNGTTWIAGDTPDLSGETGSGNVLFNIYNPNFDAECQRFAFSLPYSCTNPCEEVQDIIETATICPGETYISDNGFSYTESGSNVLEDENGCAFLETVNLTILSATPFELPDLFICEEDIPYIVEGPVGYVSYQWSSGTTAQNLEIAGFALSTYTLTVFDEIGCSYTDTITVTEIPCSGDCSEVTVISDNINYCNNEVPATITLEVLDEGYEYFWYANADTITNNPLAGSPTAVFTTNSVPVLTSDYFVVAVDGDCRSEVVQVDVTVNAAPTPLTLNVASPVCADNVAGNYEFDLSSVSADAIDAWYNANDTSLVSDLEAVPVGTYLAAATNGTCTSYTEFEVQSCNCVVIDAVNIALGGTNATFFDGYWGLCGNNIYTISLETTITNPDANILANWYFPDGTEDLGVPINLQPSINPNDYVTACPDSALVSVALYCDTQPEIAVDSVVINLLLFQEISEAISLEPVANSCSFELQGDLCESVYDISWIDDLGNTGTGIDYTPDLDNPATTLIVTLSNSLYNNFNLPCANTETLSFDITQINIPEIIGNDDITVCEGEEDTDVSITNNLINTYNWYNDLALTDLIEAGTPSITQTFTETTTLYIEATHNLNAECSIVDSIIVNVLNTSNTTETATICPGETYISANGFSYTESGSNVLEDENGCAFLETVNLTILSATPFELPDLFICEEDIPYIVEAPAGYVSYQWSSGTTAQNLEIAGFALSTYTLTVFDEIGCSYTDTITVTEIIPCPGDCSGVTDTIENATVCPGSSYTASNGVSYFESVVITQFTPDGCQYNLIINISYAQTEDTFEIGEICTSEGETYISIGENIYTDIGFYEEFYTNANGCVVANLVQINSLDNLWYQDLDNDGLGNIAVDSLSCSQPVGYVGNNLDEDDTPNPQDYPTSDCHPDYNALMALYQSTNGDNWTDNTGWYDGFHNGDCDVCTWFGIECENNRVSCLDLDGEVNCDITDNLNSFDNGNNLIGTIPTEIGNLEYLQYFSFASNNISGVIPNSIGNLDSLLYLDFRLNSLSGNIPNEVYELDNLVRLILSVNNLSGTLNENISSLQELEVLALSFNNFTGNIPSEIGSIESLQYLYLDSNLFNGSIPLELSNLSNLKILSLEFNQLSGCIPNELLSFCTLLTDEDQFSNVFFQYNPLLPYEGELSQLCSGSPQIGAPCNADNNSATQEYIQEDCSCGSNIEPINCFDDVYLSTQAEVTNFANTACDTIYGDLIITGENFGSSDIFDLSPLSSINVITGNLVIYQNPLLNNFNGLENLSTADVYIGTCSDLIEPCFGNDQLSDISALCNLQIGSLVVVGNYALTQCCCLQEINVPTQVGNDFGLQYGWEDYYNGFGCSSMAEIENACSENITCQNPTLQIDSLCLGDGVFELIFTVTDNNPSIINQYELFYADDGIGLLTENITDTLTLNVANTPEQMSFTILDTQIGNCFSTTNIYQPFDCVNDCSTVLDYTESYTGCSGDGYSYTSPSGIVYDEANPLGLETLQDENGCDYNASVILIFNPLTADINETYTGCSGDGYTYTSPSGTVYDEANPVGLETITTDTNGCDFTVTVALTYEDCDPCDTVTDYTESYNGCSGDGFSVTVFGNIYDENNPTGTENVVDGNGCAYAVTIDLIFEDCGCPNPATASVDPGATICEGETLDLTAVNATFGGSATSGSWTTTGTAGTIDGSDVYTPSSADIAAGTVTLTYTTDDPDGAPCVAASADLVLTINAPLDETYNEIICAGVPYTSPNGNDYTASGSNIFVDANGCTATETVTITENTPEDDVESGTICPGGSFTASTGTVYTASGSETFTDTNGCDAILTVTITENTPLNTTESGVICDDGSTIYTSSAGIDYSTAGVFPETFMDANGCSATNEVTVTETDCTDPCDTVTDIPENATICSGDSYLASDGNTYTTSTVVPQTDAAGCTYDLIITITEYPNQDVTDSATICTGDSFTSANGFVYTATGSNTFVDSNGCTATETVTITENTPQNTTESGVICDDGSTSFTSAAGIEYTAAGTYPETFTDANNCTATNEVTVSETTCTDPCDDVNDEVENATICPGDSYTASNGVSYFESVLITQFTPEGCQYDLIINITYVETENTFEFGEICISEQGFYFSNLQNIYDEAGFFEEFYINTNGCVVSNFVQIASLDSLWYQDADNDGLGNPNIFITACNQPAGYVSNNMDPCDGTYDICGVCNGSGIPAGTCDCSGSTPTVWYLDNDGDGLGNPDISTTNCTQPSGYVSNNLDPDDNCNGEVDECGVCGGSGAITWYEDADNDGFGNPDVSVVDCTQPAGYVSNPNDPSDVNCNQSMNTIYTVIQEDCGVKINVLAPNTTCEIDGYPYSDTFDFKPLNAGVYAMDIYSQNGACTYSQNIMVNNGTPQAEIFCDYFGGAFHSEVYVNGGSGIYTYEWHDGNTGSSTQYNETTFLVHVWVTDVASGCRQFFQKEACTNYVADSELEAIELNIYPVPATDVLYIETNYGNIAKTVLTLYDFTGKKVLQKSGDVEQLDISNLSSGIYMLQITDEENAFSVNRKVIVK